jgi:hypothetical protein
LGVGEGGTEQTAAEASGFEYKPRELNQGLYGEQIENCQGAADAKVYVAPRVTLPNLWTAAGRVSEVPHLPHLPAKAGRQRLDSGHEKGELVKGNTNR